MTATKIVNFFTGASQSESTSTTERIAQRFADGIRLGLIIAMCSVGLSLIFGTTGPHQLRPRRDGHLRRHDRLLPQRPSGCHILIAAPIAIAAGGLFGYSLDRFGFAKFRKRGVGLISQMVITLGMSIALKNLFLWRFGGRDKPFLELHQPGRDARSGRSRSPTATSSSRSWRAIVLVAVALVLQYTRLGKATRAVSDNVDLASSTGIDSPKVIRIIWVAGGALAALGGVFRGLDEQVSVGHGHHRCCSSCSPASPSAAWAAPYGALVGGFVVGILVETLDAGRRAHRTEERRRRCSS